MATITPTPKIVCDICGTTADMVAPNPRPRSANEAQHHKPQGWAGIWLHGGFAPQISETDVCPDCHDHINRLIATFIKERRSS